MADEATATISRRSDTIPRRGFPRRLILAHGRLRDGRGWWLYARRWLP